MPGALYDNGWTPASAEGRAVGRAPRAGVWQDQMARTQVRHALTYRVRRERKARSESRGDGVGMGALFTLGREIVGEARSPIVGEGGQQARFLG
jgi:hypothetical protein